MPGIRDIFARYAAGDGAHTIAEALNRTGAPSPRAQQGRPSGWSVSTIREVLNRPLYRGEIVYGKTKSAYGRELGKLVTRKGLVREKAQIPTLSFASWNQTTAWLRQVEGLRRVA